MRIVTFAHTTAPLLAGAKTTTRRYWLERYAAGMHVGDLVQAYDRNPRNGGRCVAIIRLTGDPERKAMGGYESLATLDRDGIIEYQREGFEWLDAHCNVRAIAGPAIAAMLPGIRKPYPISMLDLWDAWNDPEEGAAPDAPVPYIVRFEVVEQRVSVADWVRDRYGIENLVPTRESS